MNRSINNVGLIVTVLLCAAGCSQDNPTQEVAQQPQPAVQVQPVQEQTPTESPKSVEPTVQPQPTKTAQETPGVSEIKKPVSKAYVPSPDEVIEKLKAWDKNLLLLQTRFSQTTSYDGVEINRSHGMLFYNKDKHLLRLDTFDDTDNIVQSAVTDKKDLFILDDTNKQVMKLSWQEWQQNQPNQALFDFGNYTALLARHNVQAVRNNYFKLTPKTGETYTLYLTLSPQDYFPQTLTLETDGVVTKADLTDTQKNKNLPDTTFQGVFK
ncbi:LolA family protein [Candidatus Avelusimicrobium luingense]|uniref:LolA family protein n=1 Tax=Candidatus Avelusimicrobium luingense TaxID=3416211 RepID=UPI003D0A75F9